MEEVDGEDLQLEVTVVDKDDRVRVCEAAAEEAAPRHILIFIRKQNV